MKKKVISVLMAAMMVMGLCACGASETTDTAVTEAEKTAEESADADSQDSASKEGISDTLQGYIDNGFTIGADLFAPYIYEDKDGQMVGVDYDILVTVLNELGVTNIEVKPTAYESVILELNNNNVDCTCDGMYITDERMNQGVYFSDVIYYENDCLLIGENSEIASEEDLAGKKLAVCTGSVAADIAEKMLEEGKVGSLDYYTSNDLTFAAVNSGQADAVLCDCFAAVPVMSEDSGLSLKYLENYTPQLSDAVAGFGFRAAEKDFVEEFNVVLNKMKEDGRLKAIFDKWNMNSSVFCGVEEGKVENTAQ